MDFIRLYGVPMKTTIEIADPLLQEARKVAARECMTLRTLVERGLRRLISEIQNPVAFKLRPAAFKGMACSHNSAERRGEPSAKPLTRAAIRRIVRCAPR